MLLDVVPLVAVLLDVVALFDELLPQALAVCIEAGQASAVLLRRKFKIGYPRVAKLLDEMESAGFISVRQGSVGRDIYISKEEYKALFGCEPKSIISKGEGEI